jgi:hypothetical protein
MRAIETEYKGILFRSRLEARWAVFFEFDDAFGLEVVKGEDDKPQRRLITGNTGYWLAKSRMSGGAGDVLDLYEPADLSYVIGKCYGGKK